MQINRSNTEFFLSVTSEAIHYSIVSVRNCIFQEIKFGLELPGAGIKPITINNNTHTKTECKLNFAWSPELNKISILGIYFFTIGTNPTVWEFKTNFSLIQSFAPIFGITRIINFKMIFVSNALILISYKIF